VNLLNNAVTIAHQWGNSMRVSHSANETKAQLDWNSIHWKRANRVVRNLRQRIFRASQHGDHKKVRSLQKLMLRSHANLLVSVRRVTQINAGKNTPGVDKVVVKTPEGRAALIEHLQVYQPWRAHPTRRVYIPKANGKQRPLGIPTITDRVMQARVKNALEPEWEARFEASSYGFRPGRSAQDAIGDIFNLANSRGRRRWVVDADIEAAFDRIDHDFLISTLDGFPARELIRQWLKAGYVELGQLHATETGTPQGGVISPLLANIALHGMEQALRVTRNKHGYLNGSRAVVRYADDFVIFCETQHDAEAAHAEINQWLKQRGLRLSDTKTRLVHLSTGFDFLGFNVRLYPAPFTRAGFKLLIRPSRTSIRAVRDKLRSLWQCRAGASPDYVAKTLNSVVRGWAQYFRGSIASATFNALDRWMLIRSYRWMRRRHPGRSYKWLKAKYYGSFNPRYPGNNSVFGDHATGVYLEKFAWVHIERHAKVRGAASPDDSTLREYWRNRRTQAPGHSGLWKRLTWRQDGRCPVCGEALFNGEELHLHHLERDHRSPNRTRIEFQRLVHLFCHQQLHLGSHDPVVKRLVL
jgi:RNA-directed DNA polymerase